jgi:phosphotriesterase-related protein
MAPELDLARKVGVTALVECTPVGVGRRVDILKAVSTAANFPLIVPTGIYREPWIPAWAHKASVEKIRDWMIEELTDEIDNTGVQAGWIKLSASDEGLTPTETKILRAAAQAGRKTNAVIGSHTIQGSLVLDQIRILGEEGYMPERFIWIHTQAEEDFDLHLEVARQGAWLEYDSIGSEWATDDYLLQLISRVLEAGFGHQLLLSHDRGWYDPSLPGGGANKPFDYISKTFLPKLRKKGMEEDTISQLVIKNPFQAFAR